MTVIAIMAFVWGVNFLLDEESMLHYPVIGKGWGFIIGLIATIVLAYVGIRNLILQYQVSKFSK